MFKPVDVDVFVVEAERGLAGNVYVAVAMGRVPSEQKPKLTFFVVPPSEIQKNINKYKEVVKFVNVESEEFKKLRPELRRLAREAIRSPSSYIPPEVVEELRKK
ncbi:hypothetical protein [Ignicoccus hospitalis]|uniref:Uncharacterized protein n=1 Tax=Ignicoccus hospitalis (strain KIN4/I / DSM 18386 / JCM 14125) TaxID=453591 RepID=A8AAG7_IGNH4|nr:hypothetical protein [Ignicoccus hospitalis]ABU81919.1 hypothetical protein Igni_0737 [Ignicoccus hospitalis KIN4/I]HIH89923.1 hypothetical protein [Desulfurococcaceae archaeon]